MNCHATTTTCFFPQLSWQTAIDAFLWSRKIKSLSHRTLEYYALVLKQFCESDAHKDCQSPLTCPPTHIAAFIAWLQNRGVRPNTILNRIRGLKAFFNWLKQEGLRENNPVTAIPTPNASQPLPKTVTEDHFLAAIATLNPNKLSDLRNLTLFVLAYDTGARLSELVSLKLGDLDLANRMAKVHGKGGKERVIVFGQKAAMLLRRYLTMRMIKESRTLSPDDFVFAYTNGSQLDRRYVNKAWHKAQKRAGLAPLPFHGLRHGFARLWLLRGGDAFSLQILLGHTTPVMTRRYVTLWGSDLKQIHAKVSPVDKLSFKVR
ncbi:integrase/recombinase XerD [Candidatus Fervidibacteria bacterium JGI MDM2 SSWTFF-3-K9]